MPRRLAYANPPITEAIIDLRIAPLATEPARLLEIFRASLSNEYPVNQELQSVAAHFVVAGGDDGKPTADMATASLGILRSNPEKNQIVQLKLNGFTFSRLRPYHSWDAFAFHARSLWDQYRELCAEKVIVTRLAIRTINRLDIPEPVGDLKKWLKTYPEVGQDLPQLLDGYFMQIAQSHTGIRCKNLINQTVQAPSVEGTVAIILDIDLFRDENVPQEEEEIWMLFEQMRDVKDEIFHACITDETIRLFD